MTTLAYRNGVLASDSACQCGGWRQPGAIEKIWRIKKRLVSGTGDVNRIARFCRWVEAGMKGDAPEMGEESRGIVIEPSGRVREFEATGEISLIEAPFYAWGSGMPPALGALYMGATAERAVEIAILVDPNSDGATQVFRL
jgi:hypothetical protein